MQSTCWREVIRNLSHSPVSYVCNVRRLKMEEDMWLGGSEYIKFAYCE